MALQVSEAAQVIHGSNGRQPYLLLVDDEADHAHALETYLLRQGYKTAVAYSGEEALKRIRENPPDLLILDLNMPGMGGMELTMQLRQDSQMSYLPVIVVTGHDEERKRLQSMLSGADDYLPKPVAERELLVRVQALLRTKAAMDRLDSERRNLLSDLQERNRQLETALEEVQQAQIMKEQILTSVSHELGTPLLQVKTAVYLLTEDVRNSESDNTASRLATEALSRLEDVINNLRDLASAESIRLDDFFVKDAIEQAVHVIERSWVGSKAIGRIQLEVEPNLPPVYASRRGVSRVLNLLLDNAVKFDPEGGPISLSAKRWGESGIYVAVKDQGIGIPADQLENIFREFYQIERSSTRRFGGSGIGLALVRMLCEKMNVKMQVESTVGQGSTFYFVLPISQLQLPKDSPA